FLFFFYVTIPPVLFLAVKDIFKLNSATAALTILLGSILFFFFGALQDLLLKYPFTQPFGKTYILPFLFLLPFIYLIFNRSGTTRTLRAISFIIIFFFLGEMGLLFWNLRNINEAPRLKEKVSLVIDVNKTTDS